MRLARSLSSWVCGGGFGRAVEALVDGIGNADRVQVVKLCEEGCELHQDRTAVCNVETHTGASRPVCMQRDWTACARTLAAHADATSVRESEYPPLSPG
eukprot:6194423-Pleurochrysis_carterae.AAC.2